MGELWELEAVPDPTFNETFADSLGGSQAPTEPAASRDFDIMERLSAATAAKLAGRDHEPVVLGGYELERLVGIGGMGRVFAARSQTSEDSVALKLLHRSSAPALLSLKRE